MSIYLRFTSYLIPLLATATISTAQVTVPDPLHKWTFDSDGGDGTVAVNTGTATGFDLTMLERELDTSNPLNPIVTYTPTDYHSVDGAGVGGVGVAFEQTVNDKLSGTPWVAGAVGPGVPDPGLTYDNGITITGWIKSDGSFEDHPDSPGTTYIRQAGAWWLRTTSNNRLEMKIDSDFSTRTITSRPDMLVGIDDWTFIAFTWAGPDAVQADAPENAENGYVKWYSGGETTSIIDWSRDPDVSENPIETNPAYLIDPMFNSTQGDFRLGNQNSTEGAGGWDGWLDDMRVYDTSLTAEQIELIRLETPGTTTIDPVIAGDYNDDGLVNAADYTVWRDAEGGTELLNETVSPGIVDELDYQEWVANYGFDSNAAVAVPEPNTVFFALMALGLVAQPRRA